MSSVLSYQVSVTLIICSLFLPRGTSSLCWLLSWRKNNYSLIHSYMGFVCSGYAEFECASQLLWGRLLPCIWRSSALPDPLSTNCPGSAPRVTASPARSLVPFKNPLRWCLLPSNCPPSGRTPVPSAPLSHATGTSLRSLLGTLSGPSWDPRHPLWHGGSSRCCCGRFLGCISSPGDIYQFVTSCLSITVPLRLSSSAGDTIWERLSSLQPKSCSTCCSFVPHRPSPNPLPTLLTRESQLLPAAFGKAGGPPLPLASWSEDGLCQAALTAWLQDSQT